MKEGQRKRIRYVTYVGCLMVAIFGGAIVGHLLTQGSRQGGMTEEIVEETLVIDSEPEGMVELFATEAIQVVNMDNGVMINEELHNYGTELIRQAAPQAAFTSLEVARRDLAEGRIAAYLVIPADFSQTVRSVQYQNQQSVVEYRMSQVLTADAREDVLRELWEITNRMNHSLAHVYMSAIVNSLATVQNEAGAILENDLADLVTLSEIQSNSIISLLELPELATVDTSGIGTVDFISSGEELRNLNTSIHNLYGESLQTGQNQIGEIGSRSQGLDSDVANTVAHFDNTVASFLELGIELNVNNHYLQSDHEAMVSMLEILLAEYNEHITTVVDQGNERISELHAIATAQATALNQVPSSGGNLVVYRIQEVNQAVTLLAARMEASGITTVAPGSWNSVLQGQWNQAGRPTPLTIPHPGGTIGSLGTMTEPIRLDEMIELPGLGQVTMQTSLSEMMAEVMEDATDTVDNLHQEIEAANTQLTNFTGYFDEVAGNLAHLGETSSSISGDIGGVDLARNVNNVEMSQLNTQIMENQSRLQTAIGGQIAEYQGAMFETTEAAHLNIQALQSNMFTSHETTRENLDGALLDARTSREESSARNRDSLLSITGQLTHLRSGDSVNETLVRYMSSPLSIENASEAPQRANMIINGPTNVTNIIRMENLGEQVLPLIQWSLIGAAVIVVLVIVIRKLFGGMKLEEV